MYQIIYLCLLCCLLPGLIFWIMLFLLLLTEEVQQKTNSSIFLQQTDKECNTLWMMYFDCCCIVYSQTFLQCVFISKFSWSFKLPVAGKKKIIHVSHDCCQTLYLKSTFTRELTLTMIWLMDRPLASFTLQGGKKWLLYLGRVLFPYSKRAFLWVWTSKSSLVERNSCFIENCRHDFMSGILFVRDEKWCVCMNCKT